MPLLLLSSFLYRHEVVAWLAASAALAVSALVPAAVAPTAAVIAGILLLQARDLSRERLYVGGMLAFHVAFWTAGWEAWPLPGSLLAPSLITAAVLLLLWWRLRLRTALVAMGFVLLPHARNWIPASTLQWGISVVALGFLALILSVAINWRLRHAGQPTNPGV